LRFIRLIGSLVAIVVQPSLVADATPPSGMRVRHDPPSVKRLGAKTSRPASTLFTTNFVANRYCCQIADSAVVNRLPLLPVMSRAGNTAAPIAVPAK